MLPTPLTAVPTPTPGDGAPGRRWDVVCVGSGVGCLAAAAALAKQGRAVLVLEAHTQLGGLTHTFKRKGVSWGTGFHYTGWPTAYANDFPDLWTELTGGRAPWTKLPDNAETFIRADGTRFVKSAGRDRYRHDLHAAFPNERRAIDRYLGDIRHVTTEFMRFSFLQGVPRITEPLGLRWWFGRRFLAADRLPVTTYMNQIGASERLRDCLWFHWANYGGIPHDTSFGSHAVPTEFMLDGHWMLAEGSQAAAPAFAETIRAGGGELRTGARVESLMFEGNRVVGVVVNGEPIRGRTVVSGIGARETYRLLVPPARRPGHARRIMGMRPSCSMFCLYLALDRQVIGRYGLTGANYWAEAVPGGMRRHWAELDGPPPCLLLSLAGRFHPHASSDPNLIPAEVFTTVTAENFARWHGTRVMKRGPEYGDFKRHLADLVVAQLERSWPGIGGYVRYSEGATPLTIESYTRHQDGAAYGVAPVPGRYSDRALRALTGIPGLLLTGQDIVTPGVIGAFYGGIVAASAIVRRNLRTRLAAQVA